MFGFVIKRVTENDPSEELKDLKKKLKELTKKFNSLPYQFDYLVEIYTPEQANAMVYKLINNYRNSNPPAVELLKRWQKRIDDALTSLGNSGFQAHPL